MDLRLKCQLNGIRLLKVWFHVDEGIDIVTEGVSFTMLVIKVELSPNGLERN